MGTASFNDYTLAFPFLHNLMVSPVLLPAISLNRKLIRKREDQVDASSPGSSCCSLVDSARAAVLDIKPSSKGIFYASVITLRSVAGNLFLTTTPKLTQESTQPPKDISRRTRKRSQQLISPASELFCKCHIRRSMTS
jgi:hypothetical protein